MAHWSESAFFYHIYPLGLCGAPHFNDFSSPPVNRLEKLFPWLDHLQALGVNALYLGPLFESTEHGYDTADYFWVDRRLGDKALLQRFSAEVHRRGMKLILDGVFNHVGRHFWAFRDLLEKGQSSAYAGWFSGLRFDWHNGHGDPFTYDTWGGHESLVRLNLHNPQVREHLLQAVASWIEDYDIDGLRLDAADCVDIGFQDELAAFTSRLKPDFWLLGEITSGDYRRWAQPGRLHSVTNYEAYKGLYSSHNDNNYFELAHTLERQFGSGGLYKNIPLYNFTDNHDVNRIASVLKSPAHLYPLHILLFSMPGVPSIYYGSEFGLPGVKADTDWPLRPELDLNALCSSPPQPGLLDLIKQLAVIRREAPALQNGGYQGLMVASQQMAFFRTGSGQSVLVAVNAADQPVEADIKLPADQQGSYTDLLNQQDFSTSHDGTLHLPLDPNWGRILTRHG